MGFPEGGALEGMRASWCSWTSGEQRMSTGSSPYVNNSLFISSLLSCLLKKEIFPWECGERTKLGELPRHNALGFICWGRCFKIHTEIKRELFIPVFFYLFWELVRTWNCRLWITRTWGMHENCANNIRNIWQCICDKVWATHVNYGNKGTFDKSYGISNNMLPTIGNILWE